MMANINAFQTGIVLILIIITLHFATTTEIWPNFYCHHLYDHTHQRTFPRAVAHCTDGTSYRNILAENFKLRGPKSCMLWRLGAIVLHENGTFEYTERMGLRKSMITIFGGVSSRKNDKEMEFRRKTFVSILLQDSKNCRSVLNDVANVKKLPSLEWTPFYECLDKAWVIIVLALIDEGALVISSTTSTPQFYFITSPNSKLIE